jgi:energy-coupling factor transporter ATP-binding protein EcfA2
VVARTSRPSDPGANGALEVRRLSVRLSGEARPLLHELSLELCPGQAIGLGGRSGCGKSTLLHSVAGLVPWLRPAVVEGEVMLAGESLNDLDPGQRAHLLATALDRPDGQLFLPTVGREIAAACRLHRCEHRIEPLASIFGVSRLMERRITELSSGQRQRVALACAFAGSPRPVLLDEPTAHLDEQGVAALCSAVSDLVGDGGSFVVAEQAGWRVARAVDSWRRVVKGRLEICKPHEEPHFPAPAPAENRIVLSCRDLAVERGGRKLLESVNFELHAGEVVLLTGANGAGKSTLARVLTGLRRPSIGAVIGARRVALMLPSAELQLFASTVAAEVESAGAGREESARVLRRHRLERLAARAPWTLSRGERQRLVHATLDLLRPEVMIVDEPAQGLDPEDLADFVHLVHRRAEKGRAYLIISHRLELSDAVHRRFEIRDRSLIEVSS